MFFVAFIFLLIGRQSPRVSFYTRKNRYLFSLLISDNFSFSIKKTQAGKTCWDKKIKPRRRLKKTTSNKKIALLLTLNNYFLGYKGKNRKCSDQNQLKEILLRKKKEIKECFFYRLATYKQPKKPEAFRHVGR